MDDDYISACWICGYPFAADEPRRGAEVPSADPFQPPFQHVLVCLHCYHAFGVCPPRRRYTVRIETRVLGLPGLHARAALLRGIRAEFAS